ncbi:hypothetical protein Tco_1296386 [Tanacetum coccineum]
MYYPRFTKAIIHHFITKDKSISMRNEMFMHTALDDSILGPMRFVSKPDDFQVYGALLPEVMTNQKMWNSPTYKTYLAYATGVVTPKKVRKFKKPSSPSKKRTLVIVEEEEPEPAKKNKAPATTDRSKGINLLSEAALLEEAQYKFWGDSGDEANVQGDGEDVQDSDDDPQQADDERTDSENQETNDDEKESDNEFVHTPPNYVPTDDETNDESNDADEEKYDRIDKELYGDVNVEQTQEQITGVQEESGLKMESIQVLESETLSTLHQRITDLEKDVKELKNVDNSTIVISIIKSEVPNDVKEYLGSNLDDALYKVIQKHSADIFKEHSVPTEIVKRLNPKHKALYHALMESILEDEDAIDKGVASELRKRKPNDADKDEGPTVGSDRGLKRQRTSKGMKPLRRHLPQKTLLKRNLQLPLLSLASLQKNKLKNQSLCKTQIMLNMMMQSLTILICQWIREKTWEKLMNNLKMSSIDFSAFAMNRLKIDNLIKEHLVGSVYNLLKGTCKSYVELDYTIEECYRTLFEQLDWNNPEGHRCPYDLTKPLLVQMSSQGHQIVLVYFFFNKDLEYLRGRSNDKKFTTYITKSKATRISYWRTKRQNLYCYITKMVSKYNVYSTKRILSIISVKVNEWYKYGYLEEIVVKREDQKLYTFKEGDFKRLHLNDIEDMLLLVARIEDLQLGVESYHKKLNLTKPITQDEDMSRRPAYTTLSNPQAVIYKDKLKRKRFMHVDKLHKFSDGTLILVRDTLNQMLHELHLGYNTTMRRRL